MYVIWPVLESSHQVFSLFKSQYTDEMASYITLSVLSPALPKGYQSFFLNYIANALYLQRDHVLNKF